MKVMIKKEFKGHEISRNYEKVIGDKIMYGKVKESQAGTQITKQKKIMKLGIYLIG